MLQVSCQADDGTLEDLRMLDGWSEGKVAPLRRLSLWRLARSTQLRKTAEKLAEASAGWDAMANTLHNIQPRN